MNTASVADTSISSVLDRVRRGEDQDTLSMYTDLLNTFTRRINALGRQYWNTDDFVKFSHAAALLDSITPAPVENYAPRRNPVDQLNDELKNEVQNIAEDRRNGHGGHR